MKFFPDSLRLFVLKRLYELTGLISAFIGIFIFVSIISHSPYDPNINNLNNSEIENLGGAIGANVSNVLLQLFGNFSLLICPVLVSWAYKIFFLKELKFFALNIFLLPLMIITLSILSELIQFPSANGFIAELFFQFLLNQSLLENNFIYYGLVFLSFVLFLVFFYGSMGLDTREWSNIYGLFVYVFNYLIKNKFVIPNLNKYVSFKGIFPPRSTEENKVFQKLEPKVNFEEIKNKPVQEFKDEETSDIIVSQQNEIFLDDTSYQAPEIDILSALDLPCSVP